MHWFPAWQLPEITQVSVQYISCVYETSLPRISTLATLTWQTHQKKKIYIYILFSMLICISMLHVQRITGGMCRVPFCFLLLTCSCRASGGQQLGSVGFGAWYGCYKSIYVSRASDASYNRYHPWVLHLYHHKCAWIGRWRWRNWECAKWLLDWIGVRLSTHFVLCLWLACDFVGRICGSGR